MDDLNSSIYEARWSKTREAISAVLDSGETDLSRLLYEVGGRKQIVGRQIYHAFGLKLGQTSLALRRVPRGFIADTLLDHAEGADAIVELGAGWGCNLFHLWVRGGPRIPFHALEPTEAGRACCMAVAGRFPGPDVRAQAYDFLTPALAPLQDVRRVLVFTAHAVDKVHELPALAIEQIRTCAPQVTVLHFEAINHQLDASEEAARDSMNGNLLPLLREAEGQGRLRIDEIRPATLGGVSTLIRWSAGPAEAESR
jgi:hypothetical protein